MRGSVRAAFATLTLAAFAALTLAAFATLTLAAFASSARAAEGDPPSLRAVFEAHFCDIRERLQRIHRSDDTNANLRYLILWQGGRSDHYVQCRFKAGDTRMLCEAASGYYPVRDGPRRPHPGDAARLAALGFKQQPKNNDVQEFDLGRPPDLGRVAALMLRALHDGYGFRAPSPLVVDAPLAEKPGPPLPGCTPVS